MIPKYLANRTGERVESMHHVLLIQLPVPQNTFGRQTGNIPLAGAYLSQASRHLRGIDVGIMPQSAASYLGDAALLAWVFERTPDVIGFSAYAWNIQRVRYLAHRLKERYSPQIVLGGPEVTPDNPLIDDSHFDHRVQGPGEAVFVQLLETLGATRSERAALPMDSFQHGPSPYLSITLEHDIEGMMLLETTRGCPYHCAYCYYNKASHSLRFKDERHVLEAVSWAYDQRIKEIYFLDPSLNVRPDLKELLKKIARCNRGHRLTLSSEIRAEAVDAELAERLAAAGFKSLEIGLQSTNPVALKKMRRPTDLKRFSKGVMHLKRHGISPRVDLIVGLPGDTLEGFRRTLQYVRDHHFHDDIQVFPLSVLPGTEFRRRHRTLGLSFDPEPPYLVTRTTGFSPDQIITAFEQAESAFDTALYPQHPLDAAWRLPGCTAIDNVRDITVNIAGRVYLYKVALYLQRPIEELRALAHRVTHPYQLLIPGTLDIKRQAAAVTLFSECNPHTPFEMLFFEPAKLPDVATLLKASHLERPHYLDNDLRFAHPQSGNRAILFTVVSTNAHAFQGPAQRVIFWWRSGPLPDMKDLTSVEQNGFEGVLLDSPAVREIYFQWQDRMAPVAGELQAISFAEPALQRRWIELTARDDFYPAVLPG
jgi:hypothetical protein